MKHYINGIEIRPQNADVIGIRLDFTGDWEEAELNVDSITLTNEAYTKINQSVSQLGLFEGVPFHEAYLHASDLLRSLCRSLLYAYQLISQYTDR